MRSVAVVQRLIPHYRLSFYRQLSRLLADMGIQLTVFAGRARPEERFKDALDELEYGVRVRNRYLSGGIYWQSLLTRLKGFDLVIVEQANSALLNYPLLLRRKLVGASPRIAYWGHGATMSRPRPSPVREGLKRYLTRQADYWFAYTDLSRSLVTVAGFPEDRICVVNNCVDTDDIDAAFEAVSDVERTALREALGIDRDGPVLVYCGRLCEEKNLPFLIDSCRIARAHVPELSLLVIGDGPQGAWLMDQAGNETWIKPVGAMYGREKARHLMAGDIFVLPSYLGLSILDGFAAGLPIAVARFDNHGPEIAYLQDGVNGLLTETSPHAYAEALVRLSRDSALRQRMRGAARKTAAQYSVEGMAQNVADGIAQALEMD